MNTLINQESNEIYSNVPIISNNEISLYTGKLTLPKTTETLGRLLIAFPSLKEDGKAFVKLLTEQLEKLEFTDGRFEASVDNVIQNCIYPKPQLADILKWDKKIKTYDYIEVCDFVTANGCLLTDYFKFIKKGEKKFWVKITDYQNNKKIFDEMNEKKQ